MSLRLGADEYVETRLRTSWRARWRRYVPSMALASAALAATVLASWLARLGATLSLGERASLTVGTALLVVLATGVAWLAGRPPVWTALAGAVGLSLGGNLMPTWAVALPVALVAATWWAALELARLTNGLAITNERVILPRPLGRDLSLSYHEIRSVDATNGRSEHGSLLLDTEHGTLAAPDLPRIGELRSRIEVRIGREPVEADAASIAACRDRIASVIGPYRLRAAAVRRAPADGTVEAP